MSTWRDDASVMAQEDLDSLLGVALEFAQQRLTAHGEFFPYAAAVRTGGEIEMIAADPGLLGDRPPSQQVLEVCVAGVVAQRDEIRAAAIVADVCADDGDAIRIELEHAEGPVLTVLLPYAKKRLRKTIEYGALSASAGRAQIWSSG